MTKSLQLLPALVCAACATTPGTTPPRTPTFGAELERAVAADARDVDAILTLAAVHLYEGRPAEAGRVLAAASPDLASDPDLRFLRALVADEMGEQPAAWDLYESYLASRPRGAFTDQVIGRRVRMASVQARREARAALAAPRAEARADTLLVLVLPPTWAGGDPRLPALAASLEAMLGADISAVRLLRTADPERIHAVMAELGIDPRDVTEQDARRVAGFFGANWMLRARLSIGDGDRLALDGTFTSLVAASAEPGRLALESPVDSLYDMEKRLATVVHAVAGQRLAPFESRRMGMGQSPHPGAWLPYGRGLLALGASDFVAARSAFAEALARDGGFDLARDRERLARLAVESDPAGPIAWSAARRAVQRRLVARLGLVSSTFAPFTHPLGAPDRSLLSQLVGQNSAGGSILDIAIEVPGLSP